MLSVKTSLLLAERDLNACLMELACAQAKNPDIEKLVEKGEDFLAALVDIIEDLDQC